MPAFAFRSPVTWLPGVLLVGVMLTGLAPSAVALTFTQDFNTVRLPRATDQVHPYPGWTVHVDGQVWCDVGFSAQGPDSSVCLVLRASMIDPGLTDTAVRLRFELHGGDPDVRHLIEPEAVFQWDWWFRDNKLSEAVGVRVIYRRGGVLETREHWSTPFYAPSTGFDPVLVWDCHRIDLADLATACDDPAEECVELVALEFELRGPVNQELRLDNLYLGPRAGVSDCGEVRRPGFLVQKLQSYSAAAVDLDHDGRWELFMPGFLGRHAQLWSGASARFGDTAADHGLARYVGDVSLFLDVDNDGDQDLVAARVEQDGVVVIENLGQGRFAATARTYPTRGLPTNISSMTAADVDRDGDLDLYLTVRDEVDVLMLGDGEGAFAPAPPGVALPLEQVRGSNAAVWSDLDDDGDPDLVVAGVGILRNDGDGVLHLTDSLLTPHQHPLVEGVSVADLDGDGRLDLYLGVDQDSCRRPLSGRNVVFWGAGDGGLARDQRGRSVLADAGHCEGVAVADFDNDGHLDLFVGNRSGPSLCLLGQGGGAFAPDRGEVFGALEVTDLSGVCALDRDDDGDQDVFILRKHDDPLLLENEGANERFLKVRLLGIASNWDAIGARATVRGRWPSGEPFAARRELRAGDGYQLAGARELHFGLPGPGPYALDVRFPSGRVVRREGLEPGQRLLVIETDHALVAAWHRWQRVIAPRWSAGIASWPPPLQHLALALVAALAVVLWWPVVRRPPDGVRRPVLAPLGVLALVILAVGIRHHVAWQGAEAWGLAFSLPVGTALGASLPLATRYLRRQRSPVTLWDRLNEEFISYTHTGWCKNLETLIRQGNMLAGDLPAADRPLLAARWQDARAHFDAAVAAKLHTIAELGLALAETRAIARDLATGLRRLQRARGGEPAEVAAGAREVRQTVDRLAAAVEARLSCQADRAARTAFRALAPDLAAARIASELDTDAIAGHAVRIREHELVMVLQDLLRNAVQAVADREEPRITVRGESDLRRVVLTITDNGPGLGGRDPDQLCRPGYTTREGGSGYGLFHARKILGLYRGVLALADAPAGGLVVTLSLLRPLHARSDQRTQP